jgi:hypothetical protein
MRIEFGARPRGKDWEPIAIDPQLGEFYLAEEDEIEVREGDGEWFTVPLAYVYAWFNTPIL